MSEANNIISLPSESKIWYNTLYLASKIVCKKDEKILVLFEFDIELLYGRRGSRENMRADSIQMRLNTILMPRGRVLTPSLSVFW